MWKICPSDNYLLTKVLKKSCQDTISLAQLFLLVLQTSTKTQTEDLKIALCCQPVSQEHNCFLSLAAAAPSNDFEDIPLNLNNAQ